MTPIVTILQNLKIKARQPLTNLSLVPPHSKRKWAKDPNNTAWTRNTDTFGQKLLRSQGWEPGQYLGAKDAVHSEFYSAANASHIRAVLKDDNLGLGARRNQGDECTGLDALQELLGRLNGKSEESLGAERKKREDAKVNRYLERKLGTIRFVYGGLLVGDKVQQLADELKKEKEEKEAAAAGESKKEKKKSKKRKSEADDEKDSAASQQETSREKKSKKRKTDDDTDESKSKRKGDKDKKRKAKEAAAGSRSDEDENDEDTSSWKRSKKEKKEKRKKAKNDDGDDANSAETSDAQTKEMRKKQKKEEKKRRAAEEEASKSTSVSSQTATPSASGISTPTRSEVPHRHLARQRFIAQKRAAVLDPAALNQVRRKLLSLCRLDLAATLNMLT